MKLWNIIKGWLKPDVPAPTEVLVQEIEEEIDDCSAADLLKEILIAENISDAVIEKYEILEAFEQWYTGPCDTQAVRDSISDFKKAMGGAINAKLNRIH
tara:strand:+ start:446 stop:742 length:297 start_codon:yes stop_codon:yes gene_type:complete